MIIELMGLTRDFYLAILDKPRSPMPENHQTGDANDHWLLNFGPEQSFRI